MPTSEAVTRNIRVNVESTYLEGRSQPDQGQWLFAYRVRITNEGPTTVQLVSRHWIITDGEGRIEEVRGKGVVGDQPVLEPGQSYEYTSGCPLQTPSGSMQGTYQMLAAESGDMFDIQIAPFSLSQPYSLN